jgi:rRNA maturation protein Nop10
MAISLGSLRSSASKLPPIVLLYGVGKVGKTSLAAEFPDPLYLPTDGERTPEGIDLPTPGTIESFDDLLNIFGELLTEEHDRKTVIVDSLDGLEPLVWAATCRRLGVASIEEPGFGKGYVEADTEWNEYFQAISALKNAGIAVVQIAHPEIARFDSPTSDPYSRYSIKLHKRAAALAREKADVIGFLNYRISLKEKEVGFNKKVAHAEGGSERQIHLEERAGFIAGNRYSMPASISFKQGQGYVELSKYFPEPTGVVA